jgi:hypothetical protein
MLMVVYQGRCRQAAASLATIFEYNISGNGLPWDAVCTFACCLLVHAKLQLLQVEALLSLGWRWSHPTWQLCAWVRSEARRRVPFGRFCYGIRRLLVVVSITVSALAKKTRRCTRQDACQSLKRTLTLR